MDDNRNIAGSFLTYSRRQLRAMKWRLRRRALELLFPFRVTWVSGRRDISASPDEFVVVCLVRDGAVYLPEFLRHYRELGAKHIVLLDNGSTDETSRLVAQEPDVTLWRSLAPFKIFKSVMRRWLVMRYGRRNWVLSVDIDEFFDYPFRREFGSASLLRYLNRCGFTAVVAQMLDMFPETAVTADSGSAWRSRHRFFSLSDLERQPYATYFAENVAPPGLEVMHGGIRSSAFQVRALLTKHPLLFPSGGVRYVHPHKITGARIADFSAVLLHYKFVGDFTRYVETIVREESFSMNSREYRQYLRAISAKPEFSLYSDTVSELTAVERLLDQDFLVASHAFRQELGQIRH